jgi:hypothetical protein
VSLKVPLQILNGYGRLCVASENLTITQILKCVCVHEEWTSGKINGGFYNRQKQDVIHVVTDTRFE